MDKPEVDQVFCTTCQLALATVFQQDGVLKLVVHSVSVALKLAKSP